MASPLLSATVITATAEGHFTALTYSYSAGSQNTGTSFVFEEAVEIGKFYYIAVMNHNLDVGVADPSHSITIEDMGLKTYMVSFASNGGSSVIPISDVPHGSTITKPADPTRSGFKFDGWFRNSGLTQPWSWSTDTVTEYLILYARWVEDTGGGELDVSGLMTAYVAAGFEILDYTEIGDAINFTVWKDAFIPISAQVNIFGTVADAEWLYDMTASMLPFFDLFWHERVVIYGMFVGNAFDVYKAYVGI